MAEGGSNLTQTGGQEYVYDYNCSVCTREKDSYTEAAYFCPECDELFCKKCFFDYGCDHGALGRAKVGKWTQPSQAAIHSDECSDDKTDTPQLNCEVDDATDGSDNSIVGGHE